MKKTAAFIIILLAAMLVLGAAVFADDVKFTKSPESADLTNHQAYPISWEIDRELGENDYFIVQERTDETWSWGNVVVLRDTTEYTVTENSNTSLQYRIMLYYNGNEYYSDPITVTWSKASDITTVEISCPEVGDVLQGSEAEILPITITNTGKYDLRITSVEPGSLTVLEVIENKPLKVLKAGESDSTSYSFRVRSDYPVGEYWFQNIYVGAENLDEDVQFTFYCIRIVESLEAIYSISVETPDFGEGSTDETSEYLHFVIKNTGTAALTNVRIVEEDDSRAVFDIHIEGGWIEFLGAGEDTGDRIKIALLGGNSEGYYERTIRVYANELAEPYVVTLTGTVVKPEETEAPEITDEPRPTDGATETPGNEKPDSKTPGWVVPVIIISVLLVAGATAAVIVIVKMKKSR